MVNAIQCRATVVVQKNLEEGFGLRVGEAMWKSRGVAAAVGGNADKWRRLTGILLSDRSDLDRFGSAFGTGVPPTANSSPTRDSLKVRPTVSDLPRERPTAAVTRQTPAEPSRRLDGTGLGVADIWTGRGKAVRPKRKIPAGEVRERPNRTHC